MANPNDNKPEYQGIIDPIAAMLSGISETDAFNSGYTVSPMTMEESYELNKGALNGMSMQDFANMYRNVYGQRTYEAVKQRDNLIEQDPDWDWLKDVYEESKGRQPGYAINAHPSTYGLTPEQSIGWEIPDGRKHQGELGKTYTTKGRLENTLRAEEIMNSKKRYYNPDTKEWGDIEKDYSMANYSGTPFRTDDNGNEFMLVKDYESQTYIEVPATTVVDGKKLRAVTGPQKRYSGVWGHAYDMTQNTMMDMMYSQWGTVAEMAGSFGQWATGSEDLNSWQKWGRTMQNYGNASKSPVSEVAEQEGMFDSVRGFVGTTAGILTQVGGQALIGYLTGGLGTAIGGIGKGATAMKQLQRVIEGSPYIFGGIYAANAMNEEAKAAGLGDTDRQLLALGAFFTVSAAEYGTAKLFGATGIADGFKSKGSQQAIMEALSAKIKKETAEASGVLLSKTATEGQKATARKTLIGNITAGAATATKLGKGGATAALGLLQKTMQAPIRWGYTSAPKSALGRVKGAVAAGWEEGWEEVFEGQMNEFMKMAYNNGWVGWDGPSKNAVEGHGKFSAPKFGFNIEEFIGGMIGGGAMGAVFGGRLKRTFTDNLISELAFQHDNFDSADKELGKLHNKSGYDSSLLTQNDTLLGTLPESERKNAKSRNDVAFETLREELRAAFQLKESLGLTSADQLNKVMGKDMRMMREALTVARMTKKLEAEIAKDKQMLEAVGKDSEDGKVLVEKISKAQADLDVNKSMLSKYLDGSIVEEYRAHMLTRAMLVNKNYGDALRTALAEPDKELRSAKLRELTETSIALAEKRDSWNDSKKAMETVRTARDYTKRYKAIQEAMAKRREESKEGSKLFSATFDAVNIEDDKALSDMVDNINEGHYIDDYAKTVDGVIERIDNKKKELTEEIEKDIISAAPEVKDYVENVGSEVFYDEDETGFYEAFSPDAAENDNIKDNIRKSLDKNADKLKLLNSLNARGNDIRDKSGRMRKADNKGSITYAGETDRTTGAFTYRDAITDEEMAQSDKYISVDENGTPAEISAKAYEDAKAKAGAKDDSFEVDGIKYSKTTGNFTTVRGSVNRDGNVVEEERTHDFDNIDSAMAEMLREGDTIGGEEIRDIMLSVLMEYNNNGRIVTPEMRTKLAEVQKFLDKREEVFEMIAYVKMLDENGILTEPQKKYYALDTIAAMGNGMDVLIRKHTVDRNILIDVKSQMLSKEERESKMAMLKDSMIKMFAGVHNAMLNFIEDPTDVTVGGVVLQVPSPFSVNPDEVSVMKAMQYWHHYMKSLRGDAAKKFIEDFRLFWHGFVQRRMNDGTKLLPEQRDGGYMFNTAEDQGMFLESFDTMLDLANFETGESAEKKNSFRELFMYHTVNMMLQLDPVMYYSSMTAILDPVADPQTFDLSKARYPGDHTAEQLMNVMIGVAHIEEGITRNDANTDAEYIALMDSVKTTMKIGALLDSSDKMLSLFSPKVDENEKPIYDAMHIRDNSLMVTGSGGVGKTTFFVRTMMEHAYRRGKRKFVLVAPNAKQVQSLRDSVPAYIANDKSISLTVKTVEEFIPEQGNYKDSVVFIDELSLLTQLERNTLYFNGVLKQLNGTDVEVSNKEPIHNSNTIFYLGDEFQAPFSAAEYERSPKLSRYIQHGFNMTAVKRSSLVDIYKIQNIFRAQSSRRKSVIPTLIDMKYSDNAGSRKGVKLNGNEDSFLAEAKQAVLNKNGYMIVYDQGTYNSIVADMPADVHERVFYMTDKNKSPQGMSLKGEVYVYMPPNKVVPMLEKESSTPNMMFNRYMLTAVSRATTYVSVYTGSGMGNVNSTKVDEKELLYFEDDVDSIKGRKKALYDSMKGTLDALPKVPGAATVANPVVPNDNKVDDVEDEDEAEDGEDTGDNDSDEEVVDEGTKDPGKDAPTGAKLFDKIPELFGLGKTFKHGRTTYRVTKKPVLKDGLYVLTAVAVETTSPHIKVGDVIEAEIDVSPAGDAINIKATAKSKKNESKDRKKKEKKPKTKEEVRKEEEVADSVDDVSTNAEEGDAEYGKPGQGITWGKVNADPNDTLYNTIVTPSGFIVQVGAVYHTQADGAVVDAKVTKIELHPEKGYMVHTTRDKAPMLLDKFLKVYGKTADIKASNKSKAIDLLVHSMKATMFGKTMDSDMFSSIDENERAAQYKGRLMGMVNTLRGLPGMFSVEVKVKRNVAVVDWNGKLSKDTKPFVINIYLNGEYFGSHYIEKKSDDIKSTEDAAYNAMLYDYVSSKVGDAAGEIDLFDGPIPMKSSDIDMTSIIGIGKEGAMSLGALSSMVKEFGMYMSPMIQEASRTADGKVQEGVDTVVYISMDKNPSSANGKRVVLKSMMLKEMSDPLRVRFSNYIGELLMMTGGLNTTNESDRDNYLMVTDQFFKFNRALLSPTPYKKAIDGTAAEKVQVRKKMLDEIRKMLESGKVPTTGIIPSLRMPTTLVPSKDGELTNENMEFMNTVSEVYMRVPVMRLPFNEMFGLDGLAALQDAADELSDYNISWQNAEAELRNILGDGIAIGFIRSDKFHGFVTRTGKILMNYRDGMTNRRKLYHEIAHYVSEFLLTDEAQAALFDEVAKKYGIKNWRTDPKAREAVAERLAEDAERYASDRRNLKGISKYLQQFLDWLSRFFSKLGLVKNVIADFNYDVFVANRYKASDGKSLPMAREEMALDTLYARVESKSFNQVSNEYFYDTEVARSVARTVGGIIAAETVMPSQNTRLYEDQDISFTDIVNRVEYFMRSRVMFMTKPNGDFEYETVDFDGVKMNLPKIRKDIMLSGRSLFKWAYNAKDETGRTISGVSLQYYDSDISAYRAVRANSKGVYFLEKHDRQRIRSLMRKALLEKEVMTSEGSVPIISLVKANVDKLKHINNAQDRELYRYAMTLYDDVLVATIGRYFPGIDVRDMLNKGGKIRFSDIAEALVRVQDANIRKEAEEVNHMDRQSDIMKLILSTTPRVVLYPDGSVMRHNETIDSIIANKLLTDLSMNLYNPSSGDSIDAFADAMKMRMEVHRNIASGSIDTLREDRDFMNMLAIYTTFFDNQNYVGQRGYQASHYRILQWYKQLSKIADKKSPEYARKLNLFYKDYSASFDTQKAMGLMAQDDVKMNITDFELTLKNRARNSERVLTSMVSHFGSIATNKFTKIKQFGREENSSFYSYAMQTGSTEEQKLRLEKELLLNMYSGDGTIADRYKDLFLNKLSPVYSGDEKAPAKFYMTDRGIMYFSSGKLDKSDTGVLIIPITKNDKGVASFSQLTQADINNISTYSTAQGTSPFNIMHNVFSHFFNKGDADKAVLKMLSSLKVGSNRFGIEDIHTLLGPMIASMYTHTVERTLSKADRDDLEPNYKLYLEALDSFNAQAGMGKDYGKTNDATRDAMMSPEEGSNVAGEGDMYYFPAAFYKELTDLASMFAIRDFNPTIQDVTGRRKIYVVGVQDNMGYKLNNGNTNLVRAYAEATKDGHSNMNSRGTTVLNPVLGKEGFIENTGIMMGIQAANGSASDLKNMTPQDNFHAAISDFSKYIYRSPASFSLSSFSVPFMNQGHRGRQRSALMNFNIVGGKGNGLLMKTEVSGIDIFTPDYRNFVEHIRRGFAIKEEAQVHSLNRWVKYLSNPKNMMYTGTAALQFNTNMLIDTTAPDWKKKRDEVYAMVKDYIKSVSFEIIDTDIPAFDGSGLMSGLDYVIVKAGKSDTGGRLYMGYDTNMMDDIYTTSATGGSRRTTSEKVFNKSKYEQLWDITLADGTTVSVPTHVFIDTMNLGDRPVIPVLNKKGVTEMVSLAPEMMKDVVTFMFKEQHAETNRIAKENGYVMTAENLPMIPEGHNFPGINVGGRIHPVWEAFNIAHTMLNFYYDHGLEGTQAMHLSNVLYENESGAIAYGQNRNKRALSHSSTGFAPVVTHSGIDPKSRVMIIRDLKTRAKIESIMGTIDKEHTVFDGESLNNPFYLLMYHESMGATNGSMNISGGIKSVGQMSDWKLGRMTMKKHAGDTFSKTMLDTSSDAAKLFEIMLNPQAKAVFRNASEGKMYKVDIDNMPNDNLYQRYLIYLDNTATQVGVDGTLKNIMYEYNSVRDLLEDVIKKPELLESRIKEWEELQRNGLPLGKYVFLQEVLTEAGMDDMIAPEGEKDHYKALKELHSFYVEARALGKHEKYKYLSAILFSQDVKEQARGFEMPYAPMNRGMGATHTDAEGQFTVGRPMPTFQAPGQAVPTNLYELMDTWGKVQQDAPYELWTREFDNTQEITQLNPNREIDDNEESPMVQAMSIVLANPNSLDNGLAGNMAKELSNLMRSGMENMMRYIINDGRWAEGVDEKIATLKIDTEKGLSLSERNTIEGYVKSKIKASMASTDDNTMLSVIINDDDISINVSPGAVTRVVQYLSSFLKKEAIKRKVEAMRLVQMGGNFIELYQHKDTGEVFMKSEAIKHANKMGVPVEEMFDVEGVRTLKHTTISMVEGKTLSVDQQAMVDGINIAEQQALAAAQTDKERKVISAMFSKRRTEYLVSQGLAFVDKGEAVVPAVKFKKYDIPSTVGLNELFRLYYNDGGKVMELNLRTQADSYESLLSSIATFVADNMRVKLGYTKNSRKPRISFGYGDNLAPGMNKYFDLLFLDGANAFMKERYRDMAKLLDESKAAAKERFGKLYDMYENGELADEAGVPIKEYTEQVLTEKVVEYAKEFLTKQIEKMAKGLRAVALSTESNIGMRTPSGPGSGFINNIVGFINDNGAIGYINTIKNLIDGSDQDVDQFTMYFTADTLVDMGVMDDAAYEEWKKEKIRAGLYDEVTDEEGNRINNRLLGMLKQYYSDAENTDFTMAAINLDPVKKAADGTYGKVFPYGDSAYNFGQSMIYREIAMDGQAVGPFALSQKLQTLLYSGYHANGRRGISTMLFPFNIGSKAAGDTDMLYSKVPIYMEMLINAATDNPKLLALGAMNLSMVNADMASAMFFASKEIVDYMRDRTGVEMSEAEAILEFLKGDANANIFKWVKSQSNMINGGFTPTYYSVAHSYYNKLSKDYDANMTTIDGLDKSLRALRDIIKDKLSTVANVSDEEVNSILAQGEGFEAMLHYLSKKNLKSFKGKVKHKHLMLKKIINAELEGRLEGETDAELVQSIRSVISSKVLDEAYGLLTEVTDGEMSNMSQLAAKESKELTKEWVGLLKDIKEYKKQVKAYDKMKRLTDKDGYMKEVYLVTKYAMLGEVMRNATKVANINQFQVGSPYDVDNFTKQLTFSTGYGLDELIALYDEYKAYVANGNESASVSQFLDDTGLRRSKEEVTKAAFNTMRHNMSRKNYRWMIEPVSSPDGKETFSYIDDAHSIFDFAEIVLSRPDVMESIRGVQLMRDTSDAMFSVRHPDLVRMQREIMDEAGYDMWNEEKFNTYYEEVNRYFMHLFLNNYDDAGIAMLEGYNAALDTYGALDMPFYSKGNAGMMPGTYSPETIRTFITTFPGFFRDNMIPKIIEQLKETDPELENSKDVLDFIERIEVTVYNSVEYLDVKRSRIQSPDEVHKLREGFNGLPKDARTLLAFYQMVKDGFDYHKSFFGQVMPKEYLKHYTEFLTKELPKARLTDHIENLKVQILSNPNLGLLFKEDWIKDKDGNFISVPPTGADGVVRFYYKTVQVQKRKGYAPIRTYALAETTAIQGTHIVRGDATAETDKVVPFSTIIDLDKDLTDRVYTVTLGGKSYDVRMKPAAYIRWFIHGHAEKALKDLIVKEFKATGADVSSSRVKELADTLMNTDFNKTYYRLKGIPAIGKADTAESDKANIKYNVMSLVQSLMQEKYGPGLDARIKSLKGKVIKDKYYSGEMSPSHIMYVMLNSMGEYSAENFMSLKEVPNEESMAIFAEENAPVLNRTGLLGNYFTMEDAIESGNVVKIHLPIKGKGRKDNWYKFMQEKFGMTGEKTALDAMDAILAGVLVNDAVGIVGKAVINVEGMLSDVGKTVPEANAILNMVLNGHYSHRDININKEREVQHARSLVILQDLIEAGKIKEAREQIMQGLNVFDLQRSHEVPYGIGDMIYFPDGTVGIVVRKVNSKKVQYVLNPKLSKAVVYRPTNRAVMSLEQVVRVNNNRAALDGFVMTLSKAMPGIEYRYVNNDEAMQVQRSLHPSVSFFQDGIVYINIDKADKGVAIHEFAHPLVLAVERNNPELFSLMVKAVAGSPVMDYVRRMYGDELTTERDLIMEAIPTAIQMRYYARMRSEQSPEEQMVWESFWTEVKNTFKELASGDINLDSGIDDINFSEAGLAAISDAIINDMMRGKPLSEITTYELARMVPYTMRASSSSKLKNLSLKNIDRLFQKRGDSTEEGKIRRQIRRSIKGTEYHGLSGTYDLSMRNAAFYDKMGNYSEANRREYVESIIDSEYTLYEKIEVKVINFLYKLKDVTPLSAATETIFSSWSKRYDMANIEEKEKVALENRVKAIINKIGYNPDTDVALTLEEGMKVLDIKLPTNVDNNNVLLIIHNSGRADQQISIMTVLPESLYSYGVGEHDVLGASFIGEGMTAKERRMAKRLQGVKLTNGNGDIETLKNAIIGMAVKKQKPGLVIRKIGAMRVTGDNIQAYEREMEDVVPQVDTLFNSLPQLSASLERDLYDVVMDKSLYDASLYTRPLMERIGTYFKSLLMNEPEGTRFKKSLERTVELVTQVYEGNNFDRYTALQKAVYGRIVHLRNELDTHEMRANNDEYQLLLRMYRELTGYNEVGTNRVDQLSFDDKVIGTADRWSGQIRTWVFDQIDLSSRKAVEEMLPFQKKLNEGTKLLDVMAGGVLSLGYDNTHELFKPLFKTALARAEDGRMVEVSTHEIHWDENDAETAQALREGRITKEQLEFGKFLADAMYDEFVEYIMTVERGAISTKIGATDEELRSAAIYEVDRRYKKGMMPVFVRSFGAALTEGSYKEAFELYMKSAGRWYGGNLYEEYYQSNVDELQKDSFRKLLSPFWEQFQYSDAGGSDTRMKMMGLDYDRVGNLVLLDQEAQNSVSMNLQNIGNYTMMSSKRTKHMQMAVASVNIAMDMLRGEEANGTNTKDIREHIENYVNRQVYGNLPELPRQLVEGLSVNLDAAISGTSKMINMIHLAVNVKLGAKNAVASGSKLIINALVNSLAGNSNFNIPTVVRAAQELFSNPAKVAALNEKYQIVQVTERELINHWKYVQSKKNATEPDMQMIMHWFGDYYSQLIGAMAQMMAEGTYDAHNEDGTYDPTLDKRFEGEDGDIIKRGIMQQQFKENYHAAEDGKMTHAYSQRDENRIKVHVQRFVGELNDSRYKNMISSYGIAQAVMSMKNYVYNVAQAWWKNPSATVHMGKWGVRETNGTKESVWVPEITEGMIQTLLYCGKGIAKAVKGDVSSFKNMTHFQKRNLISMATFTGVVAGIYLLADLLMKGEDDDEKPKYEYYKDPVTGQRKKKEKDPEWIGQRLMEMMYDTKYTAPREDLTYTEQLMKYVLIGAVNEQLSYVSPARPFQDMWQSPSPFVAQVNNLGRLLWATMSLPWDVQDKGVVETLQEYGHQASRNLPYGAIYRTGEDAVEGFKSFIDNETTK